jgi:hypothetical protein
MLPKEIICKHLRPTTSFNEQKVLKYVVNIDSHILKKN